MHLLISRPMQTTTDEVSSLTQGRMQIATAPNVVLVKYRPIKTKVGNVFRKEVMNTKTINSHYENFGFCRRDMAGRGV